MRIAIVGATGAVGREFLSILEDRSELPIAAVQLLASARSIGTRIPFRGEEREVEDLATFDPRGVDVAFFSAGGSISKAHAPRFREAGVLVLDNSSAFRMTPDVPLVVPEVNGDAALEHHGLIANPNCSTIIFLMAITPIHRIARVRRAVVSTYQAVSGAGAGGIAELTRQQGDLLAGNRFECEVFPHPIATNCIPHVGDFDDSGVTSEETKLERETLRILGAEAPSVISTCVRVPIPRAHSEAIFLELDEPISLGDARRALDTFPGVRLVDDPDAHDYPLAEAASGGDDVLVGRVREDPTVEHGLVLWAVGDQLRKGAALNAVQIAERVHASQITGSSGGRGA